jgi:hypothetical protein
VRKVKEHNLTKEEILSVIVQHIEKRDGVKIDLKRTSVALQICLDHNKFRLQVSPLENVN